MVILYDNTDILMVTAFFKTILTYHWITIGASLMAIKVLAAGFTASLRSKGASEQLRWGLADR